jgi:ribose/xylose/arabinose/galactoside ABC-type transport system permease subunit
MCTDVFILLIAYILLGATSAICFVICRGNPVIASIINRVIIFGLLFSFRNKLYKIQVLYKKFWNRNNKPKIIKSATFRSLNIVIFNVIFILLYACMVVATVWKGGV